MKVLESTNNDEFRMDCDSEFFQLGIGSKIKAPYRIVNPKVITIEPHVSISPFSNIIAITDASNKMDYIIENKGAFQKQDYLYNPQIRIGEGTQIGRFLLLSCTNNIDIGKNVLMSERVFISDNIHEYSDIDTPIMFQPLSRTNRVVIGNDTWIGVGVSIFGNVSIGKHCVIGANSVVNRDIPDYCVAVGSPAKVVKRYNHETNEWIKVL